jgi:ADP-ribose pyrophosphatase
MRDLPEEWEVFEEEVPFRGAIFSVRSDRVRMPDGSAARRDYLAHPGAVGVLPMDGRGRVLVLRQYRHPVRARMWELPAGLLDVPGEDPLLAARRELWEETHYQAGDWRVLLDYFTSPGVISEAFRVYLARDLSQSEGERYQAHGEELDMETAWVPLGELVAGVLAGELHNPALCTGVLAAQAARTGQGFDALRPAESPWLRPTT